MSSSLMQNASFQMQVRFILRDEEDFVLSNHTVLLSELTL